MKTMLTLSRRKVVPVDHVGDNGQRIDDGMTKTENKRWYMTTRWRNLRGRHYSLSLVASLRLAHKAVTRGKRQTSSRAWGEAAGVNAAPCTSIALRPAGWRRRACALTMRGKGVNLYVGTSIIGAGAIVAWACRRRHALYALLTRRCYRVH